MHPGVSRNTPDISIAPNSQTLAIPLTHNQPRRAIQFIPLLTGLGIAAGIGTGTAGLTTSLKITIKAFLKTSLTA